MDDIVWKFIWEDELNYKNLRKKKNEKLFSVCILYGLSRYSWYGQYRSLKWISNKIWRVQIQKSSEHLGKELSIKREKSFNFEQKPVKITDFEEERKIAEKNRKKKKRRKLAKKRNKTKQNKELREESTIW